MRIRNAAISAIRDDRAEQRQVAELRLALAAEDRTSAPGEEEREGEEAQQPRAERDVLERALGDKQDVDHLERREPEAEQRRPEADPRGLAPGLARVEPGGGRADQAR